MLSFVGQLDVVGQVLFLGVLESVSGRDEQLSWGTHSSRCHSPVWIGIIQPLQGLKRTNNWKKVELSYLGPVTGTETSSF